MARETDIVTVHAVRENNEILFNERQQIFRPSSATEASDSFAFLRDAVKKDTPVRATLEPKRGTVEKIETLRTEEIEEFRRSRTPRNCKSRREIARSASFERGRFQTQVAGI